LGRLTKLVINSKKGGTHRNQRVVRQEGGGDSPDWGSKFGSTLQVQDPETKKYGVSKTFKAKLLAPHQLR